jgi:hypothetical protein
MTRNERGSATLLVLFTAVLLFTALTAAVLWSAISTSRHKLAAAADLTALSAAQALSTAQSPTRSLNAQPSSAHHPGTTTPPNAAARLFVTTGVLRTTDPPTPQPIGAATPCAAAGRTAALNDVQLSACEVTPTAVTVQVSLQLDLRIARPTLSAIARAGPV